MEGQLHESNGAPRTMNAGQWDPRLQKVVINKIAIPQPKANELLVRITSASLCHSDILSIERPDLKEPFTLGHEAVGIVEGMHESVSNTKFQIGSAIGFLCYLGACFECDGCALHNMLCQRGNPQIQGFTEPGFFAEYAVVDWRVAIDLPRAWDLKTASPFFCAGLTAFNSVDSCGLQPNQWFAVIGAGGLGQLATQYAIAMGSSVIAIDINDDTLEVCKQQGAYACFNSKTDPNYVAEIHKLTKGGVHAAAVYSNALAAYSSAPQVLRLGGTLMFVGIPSKPVEISAMDMVLGRYNIKSENGGTAARMQKALDFSVEHNIQPQIEMKELDDLDYMVKQMRAGTATKRMVVSM